MDIKYLAKSDSVRNLNPEQTSVSLSSGYAIAYVRDRFAIEGDTAATIARLAGLGEQEVRQ